MTARACPDPRLSSGAPRRWRAGLAALLSVIATLGGLAAAQPARAAGTPWSSYGPVIRAGETMRCNQYLESENLLFALYLDCNGALTRYLPNGGSQVWFAGVPGATDATMVVGVGILQVRAAGTVWRLSIDGGTATRVRLDFSGAIVADRAGLPTWVTAAVNTITTSLPGNLGTRTRYLRAATDDRCYAPSGTSLRSQVCDGSAATKWTPQTNGSGVTVFVNQATGQCLALTTSNVTVEACADVARQKFRVLRYAIPAGGGYRYLVGNNASIAQGSASPYAVGAWEGGTFLGTVQAQGAVPWSLFVL